MVPAGSMKEIYRGVQCLIHGDKDADSLPMTFCYPSDLCMFVLQICSLNLLLLLLPTFLKPATIKCLKIVVSRRVCTHFSAGPYMAFGPV